MSLYVNFKETRIGGKVNEFNDERTLPAATNENLDEFEKKKTTVDDSDEYYELPLAIKSRTLIWSVISFSLGILSLALFSFYYVGFAFAIGALLMSLVSRKNLGFFERYSIMGLIFGMMGMVFSAFSFVADMIGIFG